MTTPIEHFEKTLTFFVSHGKMPYDWATPLKDWQAVKAEFAEKDKKIKELEHPEYMRVFWVLKELEGKNRNYSSEVSKEMKKTIGTVNEQIRELVKLGYVRKGKRDKRQFYKTVDIEVPLDVEGLQQQLAQSQRELEHACVLLALNLGNIDDVVDEIDETKITVKKTNKDANSWLTFIREAAAEATKEKK